ncbi:hypothetical protein PENTCL1PPCAC_21986, partial [Pristionchus entomophagus]
KSEYETATNIVHRLHIAQIEAELRMKSTEFEKVEKQMEEATAISNSTSDPEKVEVEHIQMEDQGVILTKLKLILSEMELLKRKLEHEKANWMRELNAREKKFDPYKNIWKVIARNPVLRKLVSVAYGELSERFLKELASMWAEWKHESRARKAEFDRCKMKSQREKNIRITQLVCELRLKLAEMEILKKQAGGGDCKRQKIKMEFSIAQLNGKLEYERKKWKLSSDAKKAEFDGCQLESQREKIILLNQIDCKLKLMLAEIETYKKIEGDVTGLTKKTKNTSEEIEEIKKIEEFLNVIKPKQLVKDIPVETRDIKIGSSTGPFEYYQHFGSLAEKMKSKSKTGTASGLVRPDGKRESDSRSEIINIKKRKIVLKRTQYPVNNLSGGMKDINTTIPRIFVVKKREPDERWNLAESKRHKITKSTDSDNFSLDEIYVIFKSSEDQGRSFQMTLEGQGIYEHYSCVHQAEQRLRQLIPNTSVKNIVITVDAEPSQQHNRVIYLLFNFKCDRLIVDKFNERKLNTPQVNLSTLLGDHIDYTRDVRNDAICPSLSGQDPRESNDRKVKISQVTITTIRTLAVNTRDVRINAICPSLTAQDLFRLGEIMWEGKYKLKSFSVKVDDGMEKSFLKECFGVTIEERLQPPRYKIYRTQDTSVDLWYRENVFCPVYHFEGNLKTTIGSEDFCIERADGGAKPDEDYKKIVWNYRYEDGSRDDDEDSIVDVDDSLMMDDQSTGKFVYGMEKEGELGMSPLELAEIKIRKVIDVATAMMRAIEAEDIDTTMPSIRIEPEGSDSKSTGHLNRRLQPDGAQAFVYDDKTAPERERFQCSSCGYASGYKKSVQTHIRSLHTGERPFKCRHCGKSESSQSNLSRHERSHTQQKPYRCQVCGREYADRKNIEKHMWMEHVKQGQCQCTALPVYTSTFKRNDQQLAPVATKMRCTLHSEEQQGSARIRPLIGL